VTAARVKLTSPVLLDATVQTGIAGGEMKASRVRVQPSPYAGQGNILSIENCPGQWMQMWCLSTLRGEDRSSSHPGRYVGDSLWIDAGQRWEANGMIAVLAECDAKNY
jgi:hypothetical protein